jgi:NAD(P)-dependent dehydrogenase (short-subunit alcohol dehydrogenase family)
MTEKRFDGRVAIVTGSGGGLGLEHASLLAARGAKLVINDIGGALDGTGGSAGAAETAAASIVSAGGEAIADTNSVATTAGARALVDAALAAFGRVDIVINNAGILRDKSLRKLAAEDFDAVIAVHLKGSFNVTQAAFGPMVEQAYGRIVNTTSPAGLYGNFGQANYSSAKAGLVGLTRTAAIEGARAGIKVNAVSPGAYTRMTETLLDQLFEGLGSEVLGPAKVSPLVAWLVHEDCPVTGEVFGAVGGLFTRVIIAETRGIFEDSPTVESVAGRFDEMLATDDFAIPRNVTDSMQPLLAHLPKG